MRQIQRSFYAVQPGEVVTVQVQATKVGLFVFLAFNGGPISPSATSPLTFTFPISAPSGGTDFAVVSCHFPASAPDDANYQLFLTGSAGGGTFTGSDIAESDDIWDRDITFNCF
jgi:hypothetical protein